MAKPIDICRTAAAVALRRRPCQNTSGPLSVTANERNTSRKIRLRNLRKSFGENLSSTASTSTSCRARQRW